MSLLPEHSNDLSEYVRTTKGTPYAPYNPPIESNFPRAVGLLTIFPLLGVVLQWGVENPLIKMASLGMLVVCPLIGIPAALMAVGADKSHKSDDNETTNKKAKTARMLGMAGMSIGVVITTLAIGAAFYDFLQGKGHAAPETPADIGEGAEGEAAEGEGAEGEAKDGDKKDAEAKKDGEDEKKGGK